MSVTCQIGRKAPLFEAEIVYDNDFSYLKLENFRNRNYIILLFYPLNFTFVCPTELIAFSDRYEEFKELSTEILGISVDSKYSHLTWLQMPREEGGIEQLKYPLVSDIEKKISSAYNVLTNEGIALRGLFIIDPDGYIQHSTINNLPVGRSIDETLRTLRAIKHNYENPDEVCPANWQFGSKTLVPNLEKIKDPFLKK